MLDAALTSMPPQIRAMYLIILEFCNPADPIGLFNRHWLEMAEDFSRQHNNATADELRGMVAMDLECRLRDKNSSLQHFGIAAIAPTDEVRTQVQLMDQVFRVATLPLVRRELLAYDAAQEFQSYQQKYRVLQPAQKHFVDQVLHATGTAFFLDAVGGAGKTFCENLILSNLRSQSKIAVAAATSGIAATLLQGGKTAQGHLKLPIIYADGCTWNVSAQSAEAALFREAELFIWDEATMAHRYLHEALDKGLQDIMQNDLPFGGKNIIFSGDFRQTLPIVPKGAQTQIVAASLKRSALWNQLRLLKLHDNMRVRTNGVINPQAEAYAQWLLQLGNGTVPIARGQQDPSMIELPPSLCMNSSTAELIDWTFPNLRHNYPDSHWLSGRCILAPKNTMVEAINKQCLERIPCTSWVCHSADAVVDEQNGLAVPPEYLHTLLPTGLPPHTLVLKQGIPIMLLRNLNPYRGLCNGTRLIVMHVLQGGRVLQAKIIGGLYRDNIVLIPRIALQPKDGEFPFEWRRRQFPVRVCFAMTINKSQGQTLERAGIYLAEDVFAHGQLYVAASRVSHPDHIRFALQRFPQCTWTKNIVYKEVLDSNSSAAQPS